MERDTRQLDLFDQPQNKNVSKNEAKVISMQDYEQVKRKKRIIEWTLKNVPSF